MGFVIHIHWDLGVPSYMDAVCLLRKWQLLEGKLRFFFPFNLDLLSTVSQFNKHIIIALKIELN